MFKTYILYSEEKDKYYVGHTDDIDRRLQEHISRKNLGAIDWEVNYYKKFATRGVAILLKIYYIRQKKWGISSVG